MTRPDDLDAGALEAVVARALPMVRSFQLERTSQGSSTPVYRLVAGPGGGGDAPGETVYYVRAAEHAGHPLDVEVEVHTRLRALGVQVPEVVHHESFDARLGRGVAILAALPGTSVASRAGSGAAVDGEILDLAGVYRVAGRDLARIGSIAVDGFGFLSREGAPWPLRAPHPSASGALLEGIDGAPLDRLLGSETSSGRLRAVRRLVDRAGPLFDGAGSAVLTHGDVDPAHIFHLDGTYTGLIDLGELRGGSPGDDLARFRLWVGDGPALDALTMGYRELAELPDDHEQRSAATAAVLGVQQLGRWHGRDGDAMRARPAARFLVGRVCALLDGLA